MTKKRTKAKVPAPRPIVETTHSRTLLYAGLGLSYVLYVLWGLLSNSTWDDDCATRYFTTLNAFRDASEFVSLWNRPLFVIVFSLPIAILGKLAIPVVMSLISGIGAYFLYLSARELRYQYALLIVPFLLFQPFFLGTGRDAMTEPMAATIIAWGLYASLKHRWLVFALLGSALPLARTELALLLPIWAFVLLHAKQYKYIPLLALGVVLWHLAGWIIEGDALYLYNQTIGKADEENRYGSQPISTYFSRYFYVIGPIVFYFLILGLINSIRKLDIKPLVLIQFALGFIVYTLFAWKITIGQSAGFLRNLIPLSPIAALIALSGFEYFAESIRKGKDKALLLFLLLGVAAFTIALFPYKLNMHHSISKTQELDYLNIAVVGGIAIVSSIFLVLQKWIKSNHLNIWAIVLGVMVTGFALYTEPPWANMNSEREMMNRVVEFYQETGLEESPRTLCGHRWFHWVGGYVPVRKGSRYPPMLLDSLHAAPNESIIIWESHYANRVGNNINSTDVADTSKYSLLATFYPEDGSKVAYMYIKKRPGQTTSGYVNEMIRRNPDAPELYMRRAELYSSMNNNINAMEDMNTAVELSPQSNMMKFSQANFFLKANKLQEAINVANEIVEDNSDFIGAYSIMGSAYFNQSNFTQAIKAFNAILEKDKDNKEAHYNIGISYLRLNNREEGCKYLHEAKRLQMDAANTLITQYCK